MVTDLLLGSALAGCQVPEEAGFPDVETLIASRTGQEIHWNFHTGARVMSLSGIRWFACVLAIALASSILGCTDPEKNQGQNQQPGEEEHDHSTHQH